jgi:ABC-type multidrug transport system fused ATPase/permease subunit
MTAISEQKPVRTLTHTLKNKEIEVDQKPLDLDLLRRMFRFAKPHRREMNKLLAMVVTRSVQLPCLNYIWGWVMAEVIRKGDDSMLPWGVAAYVIWAGVTQFTFHFRMRWAMEYGEAVVHDLRNAVFEHLQTLSMGYFHRTKVGRNISRITNDAEQVRTGIQDLLFVTLVNVGQILIGSAIMIWIDWRLFLVMLAMAPGLVAFNRYYKKFVSRVLRQVSESFSRVTSTVVESVTGIRVTQGFARQDTNAEMFRDLVTDHATYNIRMNRSQGIYGPVLDLNNSFFIALLLLVAAWRILYCHADPGVVIKFFAMSESFFTPLNIIGNQYSNSLSAMAGAERVFQLLDTKPDFSDPPDANELDPFRGKVEFRDLCFSYQPGKPVLQDISFAVEPGQTIALVGHTGSGKSTIINLVSKFYLPDSGRIFIDDVEIRQVRTESLIRNIGIVLQVNYLFTGTVMDNIRLGKDGATDQQVFEAAEKLGCRDLLESLPQGFNTVVGERGARLSLGQRQLVCFSRAMLADPRIFILDEATSSIDTITEHRVQQALQRLLKGRTCFVVAHRLSTIRHADLVLVMDQGRIIERGTHKQLLAMGGSYARLYRKFIRQQ